MKDKREIEIGDYITTETIGAGEKLLKVESIREVDGVKKYYAGGEGVQGVHAVSEDDVVDHATPEEYQKYLEHLKAEVSSEEEGNVTTEMAATVGTESKDPSTLSEAGNDTTSTQQTTQDTTLTQATPEPVQHVSPDVVSQSTTPAPAAQQQQGNKNQNNKRRV